MAQTGLATFDTTLERTNHVLKEIERAYGWPKERRNQAYAALRAVLHAVRDRLPVEETAQLAAQLPMLVRGMYYEGWDPSKVPAKMDREAFLDRVRREFPFEIDGGIERLTQTVLAALRQHITDGEWEDVKANFPKDLAGVLP
jgi:uncharacterized protein (DUF2267 family)